MASQQDASFPSCPLLCKSDTDTGLNLTLNPWFITGFTDGEGCFMITII
jgi:hypothetical protein